MNSSKARVTAAFLVRSPLTSTARSMSLGSRDRLVAMCDSLHISLHKACAAGNAAGRGRRNAGASRRLARAGIARLAHQAFSREQMIGSGRVIPRVGPARFAGYASTVACGFAIGQFFLVHGV